jgi:hypothetical protein
MAVVAAHGERLLFAQARLAAQQQQAQPANGHAPNKVLEYTSGI